jgi:hypothetical protein
MPVAGLRGTGDWGTDERPTGFRESILFYRPNGTAPIFGLTSKSGKKGLTDPKYTWWAEGQTNVRLQVNGALGASDTLVTVDSVDPSASEMNLNYGTASHLKPGDVLLVEPAADNATFNHELLEVTQVLSDTQFVVSRGAGGTTAASISDDIYLTLMGSAYAEGTSAPKAVSRNPVAFTNYTQIFKDTYELTGTADATTARTGSAWSNDKKRKQFDHARGIEYSILFGRKSEQVGDNGKPKRFMGGLREFIPADNTTVFGSAVTADSLMDALAPCFDFDMGGGGTRLAFGGNAALMELGKVIKADGATTMEMGKTVTIYGLDFKEFILPRGKVMFYSHPLLSAHGLYQNSMFVLDFSAIKYLFLKGRDTKNYDDVQAKDEDVRRGYIQTECSLMVDGGGLSCAYLGNISAT